METEKFIKWREKVFRTKDMYPIKLDMTQNEIIAILGQPDAVSTTVKNGLPVIFKYHDIEFHFDAQKNHTLFLVYSDETEDLCILKQEFPSLLKKQVALLRAKYMTGHVLYSNFDLYSRSKGGEIYTVFDTLDLAKQYIEEQKAQHEGVEFWIYGQDEKQICYIKPDKWSEKEIKNAVS